VPIAKAKAKKKRRAEIERTMSSAEQRKFERRVKQVLDDFDELADERYAYAKKILDANPPEVNEIVERLAEKMRQMAGEPRLKVDGIFVNYDAGVLERINHKLHVWSAVRLLVAAAQWDIRISGFKLPKKMCARCGKKVK
jgi:hypothetical protein